jgi:hypothetical protein
MPGSPTQKAAVLTSSVLQPPKGYAFVIQNNRIVTVAGKPVIRKVA